MIIEDELFKLLVEKGWTQTRLAEEAGVSIGTVHSYLNKKYKANIGTVELMLNALGYELGIRKKHGNDKAE